MPWTQHELQLFGHDNPKKSTPELSSVGTWFILSDASLPPLEIYVRDMHINDPKPAHRRLPVRIATPALIVVVTVGLAHGQMRTPGTLEGTIGDASLALQGTCSQIDGMFEFWSDGKEFAVSKDSNGDGLYLNIMVRSTGSGEMAMMRYSRDGETVFNGTFDHAHFDGESIEADTTLGGDPGTPAAFQVRCQ